MTSLALAIVISLPSPDWTPSLLTTFEMSQRSSSAAIARYPVLSESRVNIMGVPK